MQRRSEHAITLPQYIYHLPNLTCRHVRDHFRTEDIFCLIHYVQLAENTHPLYFTTNYDALIKISCKNIIIPSENCEIRMYLVHNITCVKITYTILHMCKDYKIIYTYNHHKDGFKWSSIHLSGHIILYHSYLL